MTEAQPERPPAQGEAAPVPARQAARLEELSTKLHRVPAWLDGSGYAAALFTGQAGRRLGDRRPRGPGEPQ